MTSKSTAFLVVVFLTASLRAQDGKARIATAPSINVIVDYYEKFRQFGQARKQQLDIEGQKYFAFWIVGDNRSTEFFWLYHYENKNWQLVADHSVIAAHLGSKLVWNVVKKQFQIISPKGEIQASYPSHYPKYPTYPSYPKYPSYYPRYPEYPSYPKYPSYYPSYPTYPNYPL